MKRRSWHAAFTCCWIGRAGLRTDSAGRFRITWPRSGAAGAQSIELGGNCARLRSTVQAGGGPIELARRCRGSPFAALVPGQGGGSNSPCVGHWLDTGPPTDISITLSLEERGRLAHSARCPAPFRQGEPFNYDVERPSPHAGHFDGLGLRPPRGPRAMPWPIASAGEIMAA